MKCFYCETDITDIEKGVCPCCSAILNTTKSNFISYIGSPDSLSGYQKSYKLVLLKCIINTYLEKGESTVSDVIAAVKDFYMKRLENGLCPDYDVDARIAQINQSSEYEVFAVIKSQPFRVINDKGYLFINRNAEEKLIFAFHDDIYATISNEEWKKILNVLESKLILYYKQYGEELALETTNNTTSIEELAIDTPVTDQIAISLTPELSVLDVANLSVRAKNILMRNKLYTIGDLVSFAQNNDLMSLKNMGAKTCEEILSLLQSGTAFVDAPDAPDSISVLFSENKYRLFVKYCKENDITTLSQLKGFDFSVLIHEPGFGIAKVNALKSKYDSLFFENPENCEEEVITEDLPPVVIKWINSDNTNRALAISFLAYADISPKDIARLYEYGFSTVGQLCDITVTRALQLFGKTKCSVLSDKLKIFETPLIQIASRILDESRLNREFDVFVDRANKKTLQEIADQYGLTRERVRQLEAKFFRKLTPLFSALVEKHMSENGLSYILTQDILEFFDDDDYDTVIMHALKESPSLEYLAFADMFIKKEVPDQNTYSKLHKLTEEFIGEGIYFFASLQQLEEMLNNSGLDFISAEAYLNYLIEIKAYFYGDLVVLKKLSYVTLCTMVVDKYFKDGINLYSDEDMDLLRQYVYKEFGNCELPEQNRTLGTRLSDQLITCDRGKAKTINNIHYDASVIEEIKGYIDNSSFKTLYFSEIFTEFQGVLAFTSDITNYHGLHGVLALLYREEYDFSRDCITKKDMVAPSLSLSDRINIMICEAGTALSRTQIKNRIGGISDIMLFNATNSSKKLLQWDYNCFNSMDNLKITDSDIRSIKDLLEETFSNYKGYCSDRLIYDSVKQELPEFISNNKIENSTNLFYILQNLFNNVYQFSRPHICQNNVVKSLTTKDIALYLLDAKNTISRSAFMSISRRVMWSETTADLIFYELEKDYIRISEDDYLLESEFNISESNLALISEVVKAELAEEGYLTMIGYSSFEQYPCIGYEWNSFLLVTIIKKYGLGLKLISPAIRDRRYNKEIIVLEESANQNLDDLVLELLLNNNIETIDEAGLLSLLVVHRLISKVIPKELYDSPKLKYSDGYFRLS